MSTTELVRHYDIDIDIMHRLDDASPQELDEALRAEIAAAAGHIGGALHHFMRCGEILVAIRPTVPNGEWAKWCTERSIQTSWASRVMRLYTYRESIDLEPAIASNGRLEFPTIASALRSVVDKEPIVAHKDAARQYPKETRSTAIQMRADGASWSEISATLRIPISTLREWVDPGGKARRNTLRNKRLKEQAAERVALKAQRKREERDALARSSDKDLSGAYASVRKALAFLDRHSPTTKAISSANRYLTAAEAAIVVAMQDERTEG